MATRRGKRGQTVPLIIEPHPADYDGYPFITLIEYREEHTLTLVDNSDDKTIKAFVLDMCGPARVNEELLIHVAEDWYESKRYLTQPVSFAFSRMRVSNQASKIFRTFNIDHVTRVIGPLPRFEMKEGQTIKRRRRKPVPPGVEVVNKVIKIR